MTDEQMFAIILGQDFSIGKKMKCPHRTDHTPSFVIYSHEDKLFWKDFAEDRKYDRRPIGLAVKMWGCSYKEATRRLRYAEIPAVNIDVEPPHTKGIVVRQTFFPPEFEFWNMHSVDERTLNKLCICPLDGFYVDDDFSFGSTSRSPAFAYVFGKEKWQLYRPYEHKTKKFRSHNINGLLFGYSHLQSGGDIYITSSYKDVAVLTSLGLNAVCPSSESVLTPVLSAYGEFRLRYDNIYILFDNDATGLKNSLSLKRVLPEVTRLDIPLVCPKDPADIIKKHNQYTLKELLWNLKRQKNLDTKVASDYTKSRRRKGAQYTW